MATSRMGQIGVCGGKDFSGMSMVRRTGLFLNLLMTFAAIFRRDQRGDSFAVVLESIDIAFFRLMTIKAANAILAVTRILPL
ncbi:MAG: hypothetical protein GWO30_07185 [Gammaproteobacteria bacterium]|nr:hypothetical protein [Gammaproteobacteria bacterium]NIY20221.1 hypothetical protein [Gammaproteobacteria bacterium]